MREQLIQYVDLLFAGARDCDDIKQEILQNTLDRYDDLIAAGKVPEAAYRLSIAGIGDINEILGTSVLSTAAPHSAAAPNDGDTPGKKLLRAIAVGLYILCPVPLIVLSGVGLDILGLCGFLGIVAVATVTVMLGAKKEHPGRQEKDEEDISPQSDLSKSLVSLIWAVGLGIYFLTSFTTRAWHITWVIFPILGALEDLVKALVRNYEAKHNEFVFPNRQRVKKGIRKLIWAIGLAIYFLFSFATGAWYMSWLIFPIIGAVQGLTMAIMDYKGAVKYET
jgi:hypothetical protein